ncbi:hypothetical protein [Burkholderia sp. PU8-34]
MKAIRKGVSAHIGKYCLSGNICRFTLNVDYWLAWSVFDYQLSINWRYVIEIGSMFLVATHAIVNYNRKLKIRAHRPA